ncbi:FxsA family protein [Halanaerobaculum tunisiense]
MVRLLLLFSVVPLLELAFLLKVGEYVGFLPTVILVAGTGIVGVSLARKQGLAIISKVKRNLNQGQLPKDSLLDGLLILIGGVTLLTPGLLTDITGFVLIIPGTREGIKGLVKRKIKDKIIIEDYNYNQRWQETKEEPKEEEIEEDIIIEDYEEIDED